MFHDDSMRSFFRRLTFTPDGSFLLAPGNACIALLMNLFILFESVGLCYDAVLCVFSAGCVETGENVTNTTYVFSRKSFKRWCNDVLFVYFYCSISILASMLFFFFLCCSKPWAFIVCECVCVCIRPIAHLPCPAKATLAVRCCPVYFELRTKKLEGELPP